MLSMLYPYLSRNAPITASRTAAPAESRKDCTAAAMPYFIAGATAFASAKFEHTTTLSGIARTPVSLSVSFSPICSLAFSIICSASVIMLSRKYPITLPWFAVCIRSPRLSLKYVLFGARSTRISRGTPPACAASAFSRVLTMLYTTPRRDHHPPSSCMTAPVSSLKPPVSPSDTGTSRSSIRADCQHSGYGTPRLCIQHLARLPTCFALTPATHSSHRTASSATPFKSPPR